MEPGGFDYRLLSIAMLRVRINWPWRGDGDGRWLWYRRCCSDQDTLASMEHFRPLLILNALQRPFATYALPQPSCVWTKRSRDVRLLSG
jgi:hypothetical protein